MSIVIVPLIFHHTASKAAEVQLSPTNSAPLNYVDYSASPPSIRLQSWKTAANRTCFSIVDTATVLLTRADVRSLYYNRLSLQTAVGQQARPRTSLLLLHYYYFWLLHYYRCIGQQIHYRIASQKSQCLFESRT